jgi:hypothetical protein
VAGHHERIIAVAIELGREPLELAGRADQPDPPAAADLYQAVQERMQLVAERGRHLGRHGNDPVARHAGPDALEDREVVGEPVHVQRGQLAIAQLVLGLLEQLQDAERGCRPHVLVEHLDHRRGEHAVRPVHGGMAIVGQLLAGARRDHDRAGPGEPLLDPRVQRALAIALGDVVQRERGDHRVTRRQRVVERAAPQLGARAVPRDPRAGDVQHRGVDVEEPDPRLRHAIEDRTAERAGARPEVDDERRRQRGDDRDHGVDHLVVARRVAPDLRVVVAGREPQVGRDAVLGGRHPAP